MSLSRLDQPRPHFNSFLSRLSEYMSWFLQISLFSTEWLFLLLAFFAVGAVIGSFLNVVIHRLPAEESIVFPHSHCPKCDAAISFYDNIPILSWLILGGRCRNCRAPISSRYPLVEFLTGLTFAAFFLHDGLSPILPINLLFAAALISLIFIDAEQMILPNAITYPGFILTLIVRTALPIVFQIAPFDDITTAPFREINQPLWIISLLGAIIGAAVGGGFLWLVGWIWKQLRGVEAMGFGDVKLMLMVGALLGWRLTVLSLFLGALTGALSGIILVSKQKQRDYQTQIPFGIFLGLGSLIAMLFGAAIINWYLSTFVPN